MEASKKKKIIIVSSLLVIGGIVGYLLWKQNKDKEDALTNTDEKNPILDTSVDNSIVNTLGGGNVSSVVVTPKQTTASTPTVSTPKATTASSGTFVKLVDVLASGITKANNKTLFASIEGLKIYNLQGQVAWKTKKGEVLGAIRSATNTGRVNFRATNGVDYYTSATGMLVKM